MMNEKIKIGDIRNSLTLLQKNGDVFRVKCNICGNEKDIKRNKFGITKSCGCLKNNKGEKSPVFKGYKEIYSRKWNSYITNANSRNIEFLISIEYAWDLFEKQKRKCAITGLPIEFTNRTSTASLDRIDNNLGYIQGNVQWVHKKINQIKMDMDLNEFFYFCEKVYKNKSK